MNNKRIGDIGEKYATRFLKKNGYRILERNKHEAHNEIDIIASDFRYIVFAEVKTRSVQPNDINAYGIAAAAVTSKKQSRLIAAARKYLYENPKKVKGRQPRFDVIEVYIDKQSQEIIYINHIENAFGA